ncbi:MAG: hypothetical protein R3D85_10875 [Paracoccaceae bacterium]
MSYPIVTEMVARNWYRTWKQRCLEQLPVARVATADPDTLQLAEGGAHDWQAIAEAVIERLATLLEAKGNAAFDSEGAILLHEALPDDRALRDPEFWIWFATIPGRALILSRYPEKAAKEAPEPDEEDEDAPPKSRNPLPDAKNFHGAGARETLFFRLWIRAEMGRRQGAADEWEFVRPGMVDFWRSHVFRQLYAHHRPFLEAFVDFQFPPDPAGARGKPHLNTNAIRRLARELSMACANIVIEALDRSQCRALIERVFAERVEGLEG